MGAFRPSGRLFSRRGSIAAATGLSFFRKGRAKIDQAVKNILRPIKKSCGPLPRFVGTGKAAFL